MSLVTLRYIVSDGSGCVVTRVSRAALEARASCDVCACALDVPRQYRTLLLTRTRRGPPRLTSKLNGIPAVYGGAESLVSYSECSQSRTSFIETSPRPELPAHSTQSQTGPSWTGRPRSGFLDLTSLIRRFAYLFTAAYVTVLVCLLLPKT